VLISVRGQVIPRVIVWLEGLDKLKKFNDFIRTETHELPACSIGPSTIYEYATACPIHHATISTFKIQSF
jgi:hypothetical protein